MKEVLLAIYAVVRINHGNKVPRLIAWYRPTEITSVLVATSSLREGKTMAMIFWSLDNVTEPYSTEVPHSAKATENAAKHRSQTIVVSSGCSHQHSIMNNGTIKKNPSFLFSGPWAMSSY